MLSVMSAGISRNRGCSIRCATFSGTPVTKLSRDNTSKPRASSSSQRCEPRKPAPPVTTARLASSVSLILPPCDWGQRPPHSSRISSWRYSASGGAQANLGCPDALLSRLTSTGRSDARRHQRVAELPADRPRREVILHSTTGGPAKSRTPLRCSKEVEQLAGQRRGVAARHDDPAVLVPRADEFTSPRRVREHDGAAARHRLERGDGETFVTTGGGPDVAGRQPHTDLLGFGVSRQPGDAAHTGL